MGTNGPECACAVGYVGKPCEWGGAPEDPEFASPEAWPDTFPGVNLRTDESGLGPGLVVFDGSVLCSAGTVNQVITMPPYELADPFVAEVTYRAWQVTGLDIYYGRAVKTLPATPTPDGWETARFCLGEAAYGGPVPFRIGPSERIADCSPNPMGFIEVDRFEVRVADPGECPPPNSVLNGEASLEDVDWFYRTEANLGLGIATASLEPGVGRSGSSGARLYLETPVGNRGVIGTKVSVGLPDDKGFPALRFWWRASQGSTFLAELGRFGSFRSTEDALDSLRGDGEPQTHSYCLPPWMHGSVVRLSFSLRDASTESEQVLDVDDVEVYFDPACATSTDVTDPGFDAIAKRRPGVIIATSSLESPVQVIVDPDSADGSSGLLQISYTSNADLVFVEDRFWVPPSSGEKGPALVFRSNVPPGAGVQVQSLLGLALSESARTSVRAGLEWRDNWACVPPQWSGRWFRYRIQVGSNPPPMEPESFDPPRRVLFDDFQATTLGQCPSN